MNLADIHSVPPPGETKEQRARRMGRQLLAYRTETLEDAARVLQQTPKPEAVSVGHYHLVLQVLQLWTTEIRKRHEEEKE